MAFGGLVGTGGEAAKGLPFAEEALDDRDPDLSTATRTASPTPSVSFATSIGRSLSTVHRRNRR
jgi:hypothetical protein